jgi:hypothetical protein
MSKRKTEKKEAKIGRPSKYSDELADKICNTIATTTWGLHKICSKEGMPCVASVFNWLDNPENKSFLDKYTRARQVQAELLADEIIDISDDGTKDMDEDPVSGKKKLDWEHIQRAKLRVDARKWKASKLYPKQYGEKLDITTKDQPITSKSVITLPDGSVLEI